MDFLSSRFFREHALELYETASFHFGVDYIQSEMHFQISKCRPSDSPMQLGLLTSAKIQSLGLPDHTPAHHSPREQDGQQS
jgi:hypothetical protein